MKMKLVYTFMWWPEYNDFLSYPYQNQYSASLSVSMGLQCCLIITSHLYIGYTDNIPIIDININIVALISAPLLVNCECVKSGGVAPILLVSIYPISCMMDT